MSYRSLSYFRRALATAFLVLLAIGVPSVWAQHGSTGTVVVTILDQSGAVVPGVDLELQDIATNDLRKAVSGEVGTYSFVNLRIGTYKLKLSRTGYASQVFDAVIVQAAQTTNLNVTLKVGAAGETVVVVEAATPLVETTSSAISSTIDLKQIEQLPLGGRDLTQLANLVPGYTTTPQGGTWNGLPQTAQGNNIDGVISSTSRMKFGGNAEPNAIPRLESIAEMTIQTDQLDMNQGFGQANMQINFVTRRGTNAFHGRVFEDFRNTVLNANSWVNNALGQRKDRLILNEFGGSVGGPILKNKLFFFAGFSMSKQPGTTPASNTVMTAAAQQGNFTYSGGTINVLQAVNVYDSSLPGTVNSNVGSQLQAINSSLQYGKIGPVAGDLNLNTINWQIPNPITYYFPTVRVDYNLSERYRFNFAFNETKFNQPGIAPPPFPGADFAKQAAGNKSVNYTASLGFDWVITPTLVNEFRGGYLYNATWWAYNAAPLYASNPTIAWAIAGSGATGSASGQSYQLPINTYYPLVNLSDTVTWQHGAHTLKFGFSGYREQDHYYNPPAGFNNYTLGIVNDDPAYGAFTTATFPGASQAELNEAANLYATLVGRISGVSGSYAYDRKTNQYGNGIGAYNLDELSKAWGLFAQDSYRLRPNLTLNYGLRWDFTGDNHDLTSAYHQALPAAVFGGSGVWNLFNPGSLKGDMNPALVATSHQYNAWNVSPQPSFGVVWNPRGDGKTVVRAGFSFRKYTEPYQYFWNNASDYGSFFYQFFSLNPGNANVTGQFTPGSLTLPTDPPLAGAGGVLPPFAVLPQTYQKVAPEAQFTFFSNTYANDAHGIDPKIKQPYTESWNLGIQRELGKNNVIEFRYAGNRSIHQWVALNINEVNIFENGFLKEFKNAQANLQICQADPGCSANPSFANQSLPGQAALPLFDALFAGEPAGGDGHFSDYTNGLFTGNYLVNGQAGAMANIFTNNNGAAPYFCNLVGSSFGPCATNAGYDGPGAGMPINFFQVNPFQSGAQTTYMTDKGYATYNSFQVDFRQKQWHGMQFDANYTWSHTLGTNPTNSWTGQNTQFTLRNMRMSYGPTLDLRHVFHALGTVDLPFGHGKQFLNSNKVLDKIVGGWTVGTIVTYQTGAPFQLQGGFNTYNDYADGGIVLNGVTSSQLQQSVGVHRVSGAPFVDIINPKYLVSPGGGGANPAYITPNTTPGTFGLTPWLHGPHFFNADLSLAKSIPIRENIRFSLQGEFLNAFNHPNFGIPGGWPGCGSGCPFSIQNFGFGTAGPVTNYANNGARLIELRANIEF
jgi:hypothetical protein